MSYYCSFGMLQKELSDHYFRTGERLQFIEAVDRLYLKGELFDSVPASDHTLFQHGSSGVDEFNDVIDSMYFQVMPSRKMIQDVQEDEMIPQLNDVFIIRHPRYTRKFLHKHDYVEIEYVTSGSCTFNFEDNVLSLNEGELCLISPGSVHDFVIDDESTVYSIMLRRSTFRSSFVAILSHDDVLSNFFRASLVDTKTPNYLIFRSENTDFMKVMVQSAMMECHHPDTYSNSCCISLVNMLLACVLRSEGGSPVFYQNRTGGEFAPVLNYIRHNHHTVTLSELSEVFHYSKPHMCTLIKQYTGVSFSSLVKQARMNEARDFVTRTELSISSIAEKVGYNSSDHFSRVFRNYYGMSPIEYRHQYSESGPLFMPFTED